MITKDGHRTPRRRAGEAAFTLEKYWLTPSDFGKLPVLLSAQMAAELRKLSSHYTLNWATAWEHAANELIAPRLGLPNLPVIGWPARASEFAAPYGSWKTPHILRWLDQYGVNGDGRRLPWAWVEDDIHGDDRALVSAHYGEQATGPQTVRRWLFRIDPAYGLRRNDFGDLCQWVS